MGLRHSIGESWLQLVPRSLRPLDEFMKHKGVTDAKLNDEAVASRRTAKVVVVLGLMFCVGMGIAVSYAMSRAALELRRTSAELGQASRQVAGAVSQVSAASTTLARGAS
jgi:hypothetical protein